jgi:hypothetical protein
MFVRKLILLCLSVAVLAPLAAAKTTNTHPKPSHVQPVKKSKLKRGSKVKFGKYKVKKQKR